MFFLAIRYLLSKKRQTILTLLGILMGTAAYVAISGMMLGFQTYMIDQLVNNDSHIRVSAREDFLTKNSLDEAFFGGVANVIWKVPPSGRKDNLRIEYPQGWFERLDADERVQAYSPQMVASVIVNRAKVTETARLIGSDPAKQSRVTNIQSYMIEGKFEDIGQTGNRVIIGEGLMNKLGARNSETILVSLGKGVPVPFRIVGVFRLGIKPIDDTTLFGALADVQKVNETPSQISDIAIKLKDVSLASQIATSWALTSTEKVQSWDQSNENILSVFKTQDIVRNTMTISILIVAGFGIYNILNMMVNQKRREIAILRSIGFEPKDILSVFFTQGWVLGLIGGVVGCLVGFLVCQYMSTLKVGSGRMMGKNGTMLVSFLPMIYVRGFALAFFSSSIASLLPARFAGSLSPIDIIRSDGG